MHYNLKKYYFINKFNTKIIDNLDKQTIIIYRNYSQNKHNKSLIIKLKEYCKKKQIQFLLANNIKLAMKLGLNGAYIPSFNKQKNHLSYSINKKFLLIGSAHNLKELRIKELQKVDQIVISSLFKKNKNYLGIYKFKLLRNLTKKQIIPLGGLSEINLKKLKLINCNCFAGISFFEKKKAPKIRGLL